MFDQWGFGACWGCRLGLFWCRTGLCWVSQWGVPQRGVESALLDVARVMPQTCSMSVSV